MINVCMPWEIGLLSLSSYDVLEDSHALPVWYTHPLGMQTLIIIATPY